MRFSSNELHAHHTSNSEPCKQINRLYEVVYWATRAPMLTHARMHSRLLIPFEPNDKLNFVIVDGRTDWADVDGRDRDGRHEHGQTYVDGRGGRTACTTIRA